MSLFFLFYNYEERSQVMLVTINSMVADIVIFIVKAFIIYLVLYALTDHIYDLVRSIFVAREHNKKISSQQNTSDK